MVEGCMVGEGEGRDRRDLILQHRGEAACKRIPVDNCKSNSLQIFQTIVVTFADLSEPEQACKETAKKQD